MERIIRMVCELKQEVSSMKGEIKSLKKQVRKQRLAMLAKDKKELEYIMKISTLETSKIGSKPVKRSGISKVEPLFAN